MADVDVNQQDQVKAEEQVVEDVNLEAAVTKAEPDEKPTEIPHQRATLEELEALFASRYTDNDPSYVQICKGFEPPIVVHPWPIRDYGRRNFSDRRDSRNDNRRDYHYSGEYNRDRRSDGGGYRGRGGYGGSEYRGRGRGGGYNEGYGGYRGGSGGPRRNYENRGSYGSYDNGRGRGRGGGGYDGRRGDRYRPY